MARGRSLFPPILALALAGAVFADSALAGDWPRFRGPNGTGVASDEKPMPVTWSPTEGMKWKIPLPGPGSSSPIVVGDRIYITCWSGYGTDQRNLGNLEDLRLHLICVDRNNASIIWDKSVEAYFPEEPYRGMFAQHGYASHSPVSDGERIYVYFGKTGAFAFDLDGNQLWHTPIGTESDPSGWGSASSPILYKNLVIISGFAESEALVALNKETGDQVWRQEARGFSGTWGTPVLAEVNDERTDLVVAIPGEIWGFNPETGSLLWYCEVMSNRSFCSSVVPLDGVVYAVESQGGGGSVAVRAGGEGDVTRSHRLWMGRDSNRIGTPIAFDGRLYCFTGGQLVCIDIENGEQIYQERLSPARGASGGGGEGGGGFGGGGRPGGGFGGRGGGQNYSSPVAADGKLYYVTRSGTVHVVKAGLEFEELAVNQMTTESEDFSGTPAVSDGALFVRSSAYLYCVAGTQSSPE